MGHIQTCLPRRFTLMLLFLIWLLPHTAPSIAGIQEEAPRPTQEVATLIAQALEASRAKKVTESVRLLNAALQKSLAQNDAAGEAYALMYLGIQNSAVFKFEAATQQLQKSLSYFQKQQSKPQRILLLGILADDYNKSKQVDKALDYAQQTIVLCDAPEYAEIKAEAEFIKGSIYIDREQWAQAVEALEPAAIFFEKSASKDQISVVSGMLAFACMENGQYLKAIEYSQKTLQLRKGVTNRAGEGLALTALAAMYVEMGQYAQSRDLARQALDVWRAMGLTDLTVAMQLVLGEAYRGQGQPQTALTYFTQALPLLRKGDKKEQLASCLKFTGAAYRDLKQPAKALPYYVEAARLYHAIDDGESEGSVLNYQGEVYLALGQKPSALKYFQQALTVLTRALTSSDVVGNRLEEASTLYEIAVAEEELGQLAAAGTHLQQAVAKAEQVRADIGGSSNLKVGFLERILYGFHRSIALLMKAKQPEQAFAMVQKTKARSLLDLMAEGKVNISNSLTSEQAQREQELRQTANKLNTEMVREGVNNEIGAKKRFSALKEQLTQAERALQIYEDSLYALHPDLAAKRAAMTLTLQDVAGFLPEDTALLEFATLYAKEFPDMSGADQTLLFVVTKRGGMAELHVYPIPLSRAALSQQVETLQAACADPKKAYQAQAQKLYDTLLRPAASVLDGKNRLLICPDGPLWGLPFAVLHDGKQCLLERYEIAYAYSATGAQAALRERERKKPENTLLALGNPDFGGAERFGDNSGISGQRPIDAPSRQGKSPTRPIDAPSRPIDAPTRPIDAPSRQDSLPTRPIDAPSRALLLSRGGRITMLPGTQIEIDMLRKEIPNATVYTGAAAQESIVKETAGRYRYLHLASHAFFNDASPLLSSVVLAKPPSDSAEDGFLTARELFDMNLQADMVVLSACNTARGGKRSGEGIIGLTWALFVAGAPTQVVSQWAVDDASTATLMGVFYANLAMGKAAALRTAELSLLKDGKHTHPYYWAPFTLMGDWRK